MYLGYKLAKEYIFILESGKIYSKFGRGDVSLSFNTVWIRIVMYYAELFATLPDTILRWGSQTW